ncbi:hypothetical protein GEMRC1_001913 [Eukaryota sp. GEM-RC1]
MKNCPELAIFAQKCLSLKSSSFLIEATLSYSKDYTGDVPNDSHNIFFKHRSDHPAIPSIFCLSGIFFAHIQRNDLIFCIVSKTASSPALLLELLYRTASIIKDYIGELSERSVRRNHPLIHEVLDEIVDTGVLQDCSTEILKPHIHNNPVVSVVEVSSNARTVSSAAANQSVISSKKRNEVFVDVLERISVNFSSTGSLNYGELSGVVKLRSFVSGCPRLSVVLSNVPRRLENVWFPSFVNTSEFSSRSVINFNPPEGEVSLMRYTLRDSNFRSPFRVFVFVDEQDSHSLDVVLRVRADFSDTISASNVKLVFPVPRFTDSVSFKFDSQFGHSAEYNRSDGTATWILEKINGSYEKSVRVTIVTSKPISPATAKEIGSVGVTYEVPTFASSGISLKSIKSADGTSLQKWVRLVTQSASVEVRI